MRKNLLRTFWTLLMMAGILFSAQVSYGQATLKHSYTFEEGTYEGTTVFDQVGEVHGTIGGDKLTIADGKATVSGATVNSDGWISFDGVALDLASYSAITLEAFLETGESLNSSYTMLAYFGTSTPGNGCFWIQPTRAGNETRIETNNTSTTITALLGGYEVDDGKPHHLVAVLNADALTYYLDGVVIAEASTGGADFISTIGTDVANLFRGVDGWNDPNYNASLLEFNIYDGTVDQKTIAQTAGNYLGLDLTNPNLASLSTSVGTMEPAFDPAVDIYEVTVPYGTTTMTISATPVVGGVTVTMFDGLGNELENGVVTFDKDEGIDVEVIVTALDGVTEQSYFVSVFPEAGEASATLASIDLSVGHLIEDFMMDSTTYTALVPAGTASVDVTGVPNWTNATVTGGGTVNLVNGMGSTTITVTSEDGTATMDYTVDIYTSIFATNTDFYLVHEYNGFVAAESRASFNQVILADAAYQDSAQIWHFEESGVEGQYYIRNKLGNYMCLSRTSSNIWDLEVYPDLPAVGLDSARFILNEFEPGRFRIISVRRQQVSASNNMLGPNNAELGSPLFSDKWRSSANDPLTVFNIKLPEDVVSEYDLHLSDLSVNGASLKPVFNPAYKVYYTTIPVGVNSVEVSATARDTVTPPTITGTGTVDVSDGKGTITVTVAAAADPSKTREYMIHYLADTELTLMHSYTFDDGTANDQVGDAHGEVHGGTFADSTFISAAEGDYIILPADKIALNSYPSFTMEAHVTTGANPGWTMFAYFGTNSGGDHTFFISLAGNTNQARAVLNLGSGETQAGSNEPGTGEVHHYVSVVTNDTIYWYVDGALAQKTALPANYLIKDIAIQTAWLAFGAYNDPTWLGTTNEFNIYSGQMDAETVAQRAQYFLGNISTDVTLASLTVDAGELIPAFDPKVTSYSVVVPEGTDSVHVTAVPNDERSVVEGAGAVDVSSGSGTASITVTAENGSSQTYTIAFSTPEEITLMHSYTFEDGTAADVVGGADGTLMGAGTIMNGAYTAAANGDYIELPAAEIAIYSYTAITLEAYIYADVDNTGATMMAYFGGNENGLGGNGYFVTPDRWSESRTAITCGNITAPWSNEQGVTGDPVTVGEKHHVVSVLTNESIKFYIDGILVGEDEVSDPNSIGALSDANAWLCKGGYDADPTWMGTIEEFNIYQGVMDAATVAERAKQYPGGITMMHSYTFEDGTAADVIGGADGTPMGAGTIANGAYTAAANGDYIELPAADIAINTYSAITLEAFINADVDNTGATMMAYFGGNENGVGGNGYFFTPDRWTESRTGISCGNLTQPWTVEQGVTGAPVSVGYKHHVVSVLTDSTIAWYIDGELVGQETLSGDNKIANLSTANAWLCKGGYDADPTWMGTIYEFNIYEGVMDAATVAARSVQYLESFDASLAALSVDEGIMNPAFDPEVTTYYVTVPAGTSSVTITAEPKAANATVSGDGAVDVSSGSVTNPVVVTAADGMTTKTYNVIITTPGDFTKMHSYTFEDGTANDVVGSVHGTVIGNVTIEGGKATVDTAANGQGQNYGYISFDGAALALNTYSAITFEAKVVAGEGANDWYTMLYYFGDNTTNCVFHQLTEGDWGTVLKTQGDNTTAWAYRAGVVDDGQMHHVVAVVTDTTLFYYLDGVLIASGSGTGIIGQIGTQFAHLFRGPDGWNDDNWIGSFEEFNIYEGVMDALTIDERANGYLTDVAEIPTVSESMIKVYPTYSTGAFTVETQGNHGTITVYNLLGRQVMQKQIESQREMINVRDRGMYLIRVDSDGVSETFKVFKTR